MQHFSTLSAFLKYAGQPAPEHPQLYVLDLAANQTEMECSRKSSPPITGDIYNISLKKVTQGSAHYGRTKYDFQKGVMVFTPPRQIVQWNNVSIAPSGFSIYFHEDYIKGYDLARKIKQFAFFDYATYEALHLSPKEEGILTSIFKTIETEYYNNQDDFSKDIIISHLEALLSYCERFYKRQFINRKELNSELFFRLKTVLMDYLQSGSFEVNGIPKVEWIADKLEVSQRYLNDSLKVETGKTTIEQINLFLMDEAKTMLLNKYSISETAYKLGFEYPQYFSRLFKKKVGLTPSEYIHQNISN
ncbi:helix-turn-helix domain-containing protein [Labilibacter marinus]|uniref:helix-turn-helix domain-containing protein n=1 Tax=Labilibacter marinus TaxID=1477105 RepID=UPI00094F520A|nr:helix-turn-helix transcriptional regulator [Labilibacter marinus]